MSPDESSRSTRLRDTVRKALWTRGRSGQGGAGGVAAHYLRGEGSRVIARSPASSRGTPTEPDVRNVGVACMV
jgi:hypothetical protein